MIILYLIFIISLGYLGLMLFAKLRAHKMIFPAPQSSYDILPELFFIPFADSRTGLAAIYLESDKPRGTLLYCHGNAEDLGHLYPLFLQYRERGYNILAFDYPGYGKTEGTPSESLCELAVTCAYDYLICEKKISPNSIYVYGRSLGGGPAFYIASLKNVAGLIVEGTYTSTYRVLTRIKLIHWDCFDNLKKVSQIQCPLLVIHGREDRTVPFWHGEKLYKAYRGKKSSLFIETAGHNDVIEVSQEDYWKCLEQFIC